MNKQTVGVWNMDTGKQVHSRELDAVEAFIRREHDISATWIDPYRKHPRKRGSK